VSTGVNSPRTAGTQKNFSHLHLKLSYVCHPLVSLPCSLLAEARSLSSATTLSVLKNFMSVFPLFVSMVKSNIAELVASTTSSGSGLGGTLTVNLSVTSGSGVIQQGSVYYLNPNADGYYFCGLQLGNQSVQYTWTLNVSATPVSLASGATVSVEITYFDTYPGRPYYTEPALFTLNSNGQASGEFSVCMVPVTIFPESSVGIRVTSVESTSGQPINYTSSSISIIPQ